jgi:quinoprotein glucose dehydrogenase
MQVDKLMLLFPGMGGGAEWGGPAVDPETGVLYVNANEMVRLVGLFKTQPGGSPGQQVFDAQCSGCHGANRRGSQGIPSLVDIQARLTDQEIVDTVHEGKGPMPAFSLSDEQTQALVSYLKTPPPLGGRRGSPVAASADASAAPPASAAPVIDDMPYDSLGRARFLDPDGYPATKPPWGTLSAINMNTGKYLWKIPLGNYPELAAKGLDNTGSENYGGPIVTAGGLVFIGATVFDQKFRAFDSSTGKLLWETTLPYGGLATPSTYMVNGKQYVVIAATGGQTNPKPTRGVYVAFALP